MNWELYEVWAEGDDGFQELIDTTKSKTEAFELAQAQLDEGYLFAVVFQETEDGDTIEIKRFEHG